MGKIKWLTVVLIMWISICSADNIICKWEDQRFKEGDVICDNENGYNRKILKVQETDSLYAYMVSTNMHHGEVWKWCTQYELRNYKKAQILNGMQAVINCPSCKRMYYLAEEEIIWDVQNTTIK